MEWTYSVYVKVDSKNRIVAVDSDYILTDTTGYQKIDEGMGDKYRFAQVAYFEKPIMNENGILHYAYVPDGSPKWRERTQEEMDADYVPPPDPPKSNAELQAENALLRAQVQSLADRGEFIEDCIAEMAMQVYQ